MMEKIKKNKTTILLAIVAAAIIFGAIFISYQGKIKEVMPGLLPPDAVAEKTINYINDNILAGVSSADLVEILDEGSVYKIRLKIEEMEFDSYISKDGRFLFPEGYDMEEIFPQAPDAELPNQPEESPVSEEEMQNFVSCLAGSNFMIYGANWCGWTTSLVSMLGGWEIVKPIYTECTEKQDLCQEKKITGYPTILIKESQHQGARTFEEFSEITGCQAPEGSQQLEQNLSGGC